MAQLLHANATTTQATRRAIQANQESLNKAAKRFNVNWKTIDRWRKRDFVEDLPMGPKHTICFTVKRGGWILIFGHTLACLQINYWAVALGLELVSCVSSRPRQQELFQFYILYRP